MNTTIPKLLHDDSSRRVGTFTHYFRMPEPLFNKLLEMVTPITKKTRYLNVACHWSSDSPFLHSTLS